MLKCYSAGPGLFPRTLSDGRCETWEEAQQRVRDLNSVIDEVPFFESITPSNNNLVDMDVKVRAPFCMLEDLLYATRSDIVFADITPFGGREPDCGTVVEATSCVLAGGLLVLWMDPLTTFGERYADADVHPNDPALGLNVHCNLMLEQLFKWSWKVHFGYSVPVFGSLREAVTKTAAEIGPTETDENGRLWRMSLLDELDDVGEYDVMKAIQMLLDRMPPELR